MTAKHFFTCSISFLGSNFLFAQSSLVLQTKNPDGLEVMDAIHFLEQNALIALIGAVIFIGLVWLCAVLNACNELNKPQKQTTRPSSIPLLVLIAGLSIFCTSCSVEQRARAAQYRVAAEADYRSCPLRHHHDYNVNIPFNNRYYSSSTSNLYGPVFCKHCGYQIRGGY